MFARSAQNYVISGLLLLINLLVDYFIQVPI